MVCTGDVVEQVCRIASQVNAAHVHLSTDVSAYARARQTDTDTPQTGCSTR
jgi:thiamine monophosphate synthase